MTHVQIFATRNSQATRAAERFFKERRAPLQFVDLKRKPMAYGEIKRFLHRYTLQGLLDEQGKAYADAGLPYLKLNEQELLSKIDRAPDLLRLPLVRAGNKLSIGLDEGAWKSMLTAG
ncbi:MAG: arsenate reductase [Bryobacteraceae bacterium]|nr:arsenate reductase [Bryobacteraceae bacterium]